MSGSSLSPSIKSLKVTDVVGYMNAYHLIRLSPDRFACFCQKLAGIWNCDAASPLQAFRHCSCKEGSAGLVMPQDVPKVN